MAHRAATDEICVAGGYGERPIKQKAGTRQSLRLVSFGSKRPCLPKQKRPNKTTSKNRVPISGKHLSKVDVSAQHLLDRIMYREDL